MKKILTTIAVFVGSSIPLLVLAAIDTDGIGSGVKLQNPLKSQSITELLQSILSVIMIFAVPLIVFMIIYAGFTYVMAQGNESKVRNAHSALLFAIIGGVIILGAQVLLTVIQGTVDAFK